MADCSYSVVLGELEGLEENSEGTRVSVNSLSALWLEIFRHCSLGCREQGLKLTLIPFHSLPVYPSDTRRRGRQSWSWSCKLKQQLIGHRNRRPDLR